MTLDTSSTGSSVVIAATFTAEPIAPPLLSWWRWLESSASLHFAPYDQVFQQLLDPHSLLSANRAGTNILLVRIEDWCQTERFAEAPRRGEEFLKAVEHFTTVSGVSALSSGQLLVCFCPSSTALDSSTRASLASIESELIAGLTKLPHVMPIASYEASQLYPVSEVEDSVAKRAGQIPYTQAYYTALASLLARRLFALRRRPAKVIALDCDQTLWDGVCGEVGWRGVAVSQERRALQRSLLQLRDMGYLLCLCSKNSAEDAWQVFEQHPDMLLRREHFTAVRLNWSTKSQSLRELAEQLNLGLDSFVFIDDNPLECAEVRAHLPQVLTLQLPESSGSGDAAGVGGIANFLQHVWALDRSNVTDEDRQRAERYTQDVHRSEAREQVVSLEQFLSELNLQVNFLPLSEERIERGAQLTERTNQFNFTTRRRTAAELRQWCVGSQAGAFMVDASDRFGHYGLVGLVLYELEDATLRVDSLMLSCRALGRRIELHVLSELCRVAQQHDCLHIELPLIETDKNQPAQDFAERTLGAFRDSSQLRATTEGTRLYCMTAEQLATAVQESRQLSVDEYPPTIGSEHANNRGSKNESTDLVNMTQECWPWELCQRIATDWSSVDKVLRKIDDEARARPELDEAYSPPQTEIERQVVELCQSVLNVVPVGIHDGLKSLGASSLHIVQIYSRLEQTFHAGLSITDLFALSTVAAIIELIEKTKSAPAASGRDSQTKSQANKQPHSQSVGSPDNGIAIIGMAGRFPGAANVRELWSNITAGVCSIVDIPDVDLNLPQDSPLRNNANLVRKSASVEDADKFDAKFFGIFPKEATLLDPQHRLLLENCWHAIEDAGYNVDTIDVPVGVFAGCYMDTYMLASLALSPKWLESLANAFHGGDLLTELGNDKDYLATRVSFLLNLRGPAITVQTACSTSLVAIAQACQSLVSGQCDMALAGGATLKLPQNRGYLYTEGGMVSPDGVCRAFDARARGTVFGEGCGVVLLKRVDDALADGDDIYAVIKGWGLNNDGRTKLSYTAPSVEGQAGAIAMAHRMAGIEADSITLIEAHGTGTSLGDPIEIESLSRVFRQTTDKRQYCAIGSLKTNVGHLDVAAGVAGLIKASLALRNRVLPPSLNYEQPNPNIDFESSPFFVNTQLRDWEAPFPRCAGLSSFGVGGTNAHVVIEEAPPLAVSPAATTPQTAPQLILLSARSAAALEAQRLALVQHLQDHPQLDMADVAFTLQTGRKTFNYSLAAVVNDLTQAIEVLREKPPQQVFEQRQVRRGKSVVFMFPGQGSQHLDMARDLYDSDSIFREAFDRCSELLLAHLGCDLREMVFLAATDSTESATERLNQTSVAQAALFTVSYALAKRLRADGVVPSRMIGHSVGEFVAACLAGVFSLEEALRLIAFRAMRMQQMPTGSMLAVRMTEAETLEELPNELSLAAINGPQLCVVSGPTSAVEQWQQKLEAAEVISRRLHTSHAFHSAMMDPVVEPFAEQLRGVALQTPQIPIVSTVTGQPLTDAQAVDPNYWARHLRETVRFTDALAAITTDSDAVLLEVGPGQTLSTLARQHPGRNGEQSVLATLPHAKQSSSAREHLLLALGRLWQAGVDVDWKSRFGDQHHRRRLHLPVYPFERLRYWLEPERKSEVGGDEIDNEFAVSGPVPASFDAPAESLPERTPPAVGESAGCVAEGKIGGEPPSYLEAEWDELTRRVIQQQLQLMQQQLQAWRS
ncbi:MAG: HAD-IIIC family phosphatase [Pirellulaceae bacterium]|nr:HAD-IIIC family phosphatase [Pirellulaceae bacterium]